MVGSFQDQIVCTRDPLPDIPLAFGDFLLLSWMLTARPSRNKSLPGGYIPRVEKERGMLEVP